MPAIPNDLIDSLPPGAATPTRPSRRQTILSLVEALLGEDVSKQDINEQASFEDDRDVPTIDDSHQVAGAEAFNKFQKRINNLDKELRNFANAARQLGSSVGILSSTFHLRGRLAQILFLFRENASDLFPRKVRKPVREVPVTPNTKRQPKRSARHKAPPHVARPTIPDALDLEDFPAQLEALAVDVTTFVECLNEFPEFNDEAVNSSIESFNADLKYWASCLQEYKYQFRYPAVQRYIHDLLTSEMGEHIDSITSTLSMFIEIGVPTIRFAQKHGATNLLNLSTVATFFSAVTATTLQFSYALPSAAIVDAVNCFWFASMVFSIGAAVNSLLGLTWKQAMYRSPGHRVPWWVLIWIKRSPLVFLVMAVACFSIGLCCFAYASHQSHVTSTITTVLTAFTSFGLVAVSTWFASERWTYLRHQGKKWLGDVLVESKDHFFNLPGMGVLRRGFRWGRRHLCRVGSSLKRASSLASGKLGSFNNSSSSEIDVEAALSYVNTFETTSPTIKSRFDASQIPSATEPKSSGASPVVPSSGLSEKDDTSPTTPSATPSKGKQLWKSAFRNVRMRSIVSAQFNPVVPRRQRTTSSTLTGSTADRKKATDVPVTNVLRSRVAALVPKLKCLGTTQDLAGHSALVRHLQFSPDGKFLATCSWDRTSVIFAVGEPFTSHRVLAHPSGFVGQVAWSPNGNLILTKLNRSIKVWTEDGVCKKTIDRNTAIESITWFPGATAFMSVEGSHVVKLDLQGNILDEFHFDRIKLHDVAVTPDGQRLLGVGPLLQSPGGLVPSKSRVEKRLFVYNMETRKFENQTPVLNDVRDITLARNGHVALISYENKAPPQLWKLELLKDRGNNSIYTARLTLRHTYLPKTSVDFAGPSYFGGKEDELVLCAGKAGDIHIWDQESGTLLHHVRAQDLGGDLTCIAWNHAAENPFMFATGSHDGAVRIWTQPAQPVDSMEGPSLMTNGLRVIRSSSPLEEYDIHRSDSPVTQQDFESLHTHESSQIEYLPLARERTVAFALTPAEVAELQETNS